jgi:glycyl-tRNA synthetase
MLDKMMRVQNMVSKLSFALRIDEDMHQVVLDAASLAMSDLATAVVTEFTSLSGIMARHYAIRDGYSEQVIYLTSKCFFFFFIGFIYVNVLSFLCWEFL